MNVRLSASARCLALVSFLATMLALPTQARAAEHQLFIFVMNQYGLPVEDLGADEVIIESRGDQCTVRSVRPETDPMTVALLVDNSEPATRSLNSLRAGLKAFLGALPEQHKVGLFTISGQTTQVMEFTTDREALIAHADNLFADQGTAAVLLDGLVETWNRRFDDDDAWPVFVTIVYDGAEASRSVREQQFDNFVNELRARAATVHAVLMSIRGSKYPPAKPGALVVSRSKRHDVTATRSLAPPKGGYSSNRSCSSRRSSRSCCWMYSRTTRSSCPTVET